MTKNSNEFVWFEYRQVDASRTMEALYADGYRSFGWQYEGAAAQAGDRVRMQFKRDRKIPNKAELTRLQRQFEACAREVETLERSRTTTASAAAFSIGLAGTVFLGGSVFAYLHGMLPLMVLLAIPGFAGWLLPYFSYRGLLRRRAEQIAPLVEKKTDEICRVCEEGSRLITA